MKTKKPVAIVYGWDRIGEFDLISDLYYWENINDFVKIFSFDNPLDFEEHFKKIDPDVVVTIGEGFFTSMPSINKRFINYQEIPSDDILANDIVAQATFINSSGVKPKFSIFTPTYKTGDRIFRTYESLRKQTVHDWEWVVVDDSPDDETWKLLQQVSEKDFRVKPYKITPITGGVVGLAKNRACHLCEGEWLVELDHDDCLTTNALEELHNASTQFPDAGFMYSEVCELFDNGEMKYYTNIWGDEGYAHPNNGFNGAFGIHFWVDYEGKQYLNHRYSDINPMSIRFNYSMPNHIRVWKREVYFKIGGHNKRLPVADDFELIVRTFLETRIVHIKKMLYLQYNNGDSTVDNNVADINRRARLIKDHFDMKIHQRILELGKIDWMWDETENRSYLEYWDKRKYFEGEQVMNYVYL